MHVATVFPGSCRAPYGARGLKWRFCLIWTRLCKSRPVWGAWIEMLVGIARLAAVLPSRPVWGAWIEIYIYTLTWLKEYCRAPYGARGLKFLLQVGYAPYRHVAPRMGRVD